MSSALPHLLVVPIVLPLLAAAILLLLGDRRPRFKSIVNVGTTLASLLVSLAILRQVDADGVPGAIGVYLTANWEAPLSLIHI